MSSPLLKLVYSQTGSSRPSGPTLPVLNSCSMSCLQSSVPDRLRSLTQKLATINRLEPRALDAVENLVERALVELRAVERAAEPEVPTARAVTK